VRSGHPSDAPQKVRESYWVQRSSATRRVGGRINGRILLFRRMNGGGADKYPRQNSRLFHGWHVRRSLRRGVVGRCVRVCGSGGWNCVAVWRCWWFRSTSGVPMCVRARYVLTHVALVQFLSCVHRIRLAENKQCFLQKAYLESGPPAKYSPSTSPPFPRFSISRVSPCGLLWNSEKKAEAFEYSHVKLLACEFGACWYTHTHRLHTCTCTWQRA
jgi:hypothetical protein